MRRATTAAWAAVLCSTLLSSAGCDPVVPFRKLPDRVGLAVHVLDSSTRAPVPGQAHVVAMSSDGSYELELLNGSSYFGVKEPGVYTVYVEADGYVPAVFQDVEVLGMNVDQVEGLRLVSLLAYLDRME